MSIVSKEVKGGQMNSLDVLTTEDFEGRRSGCESTARTAN